MKHDDGNSCAVNLNEQKASWCWEYRRLTSWCPFWIHHQGGWSVIQGGSYHLMPWTAWNETCLERFPHGLSSWDRSPTTCLRSSVQGRLTSWGREEHTCSLDHRVMIFSCMLRIYTWNPNINNPEGCITYQLQLIILDSGKGSHDKLGQNLFINILYLFIYILPKQTNKTSPILIL